MNANLVAQAHAWIAADPDPATRAELQALIERGDATELAERFAGRLTFGTAGLRAALGAGPMRMNRLVVRQTTAGLADYLLAEVPNARTRGVYVGYDARIGSDIFAREAAGVLAEAGFTVWLAEQITATPVTAWGVRAHGAAAGIMVTASHNPPEDNGYKVYWGNGAQIIPPHDAAIAAAIDRASLRTIESVPVHAVTAHALVHCVRDADEAAYLDAVLERRAPTTLAGRDRVRIAYSAMHGVGAHLVVPLLRRAGYAHVTTVSAQIGPDGSFPTVRFPNPEEPGALDRLLAVADATGANLALASDPDADRLAVAIIEQGRWRALSGDEIGTLLASDRLSLGHGARAVGTTVVSSRMLDAVAESAGATCFRTLTGFKWIANRAMELESGGTPFVFGYEEAIGFSVGNLVGDKDGVSAALAFADFVARLTDRGLTVADALRDLRVQHGVYATTQRSIRVADGGRALGAALRAAPPTAVDGIPVATFVDLSAAPEERPDGWRELPATNALFWFLSDKSRVIVRPSGTEPKVKIYFEVVEPVAGIDDDPAARARAQARLRALAESFVTLLPT